MSWLTFCNIAIIMGPLVTSQILASPHFYTRRWAYLTGLVTMPAWFYIALDAGSWGLAVTNVIYAVSYLRGIRSHWFADPPSSD